MEVDAQNIKEPFVFKALTDDLIEKPDALHSLVDVLRVEVREVGDRGEQDPCVGTTLGIEVLEKISKAMLSLDLWSVATISFNHVFTLEIL